MARVNADSGKCEIQTSKIAVQGHHGGRVSFHPPLCCSVLSFCVPSHHFLFRFVFVVRRLNFFPLTSVDAKDFGFESNPTMNTKVPPLNIKTQKDRLLRVCGMSRNAEKLTTSAEVRT